jgi:hypothetical protein
MCKRLFCIIVVLLTTVSRAMAWDGSGTSADPYLIKNSADWKQLADGVSGGNSYSGQYFEMGAGMIGYEDNDDQQMTGISDKDADEPMR